MSNDYDMDVINKVLKDVAFAGGGAFSDDEIIIETLANDKSRCGICGLPYHRYSTGDPEHDFDAVACVNGLLYRIGVLTAEIMRLRELVNEQSGSA